MFIGRKLELEQLKAFFNRKIAGLAVCCGRRRIGKSTLIENFTCLEYSIYIKTTI